MIELSQTEQEQRRYVANNALATMWLEGLEPSQDVKDLVERYASGDISADELYDAIEGLLNTR
jgi:antitoxin VbhA-like protein